MSTLTNQATILIWILCGIIVSLLGTYWTVFRLFLDVKQMWSSFNLEAEMFNKDSIELFQLMVELAQLDDSSNEQFQATQRRLRRDLFYYRGVAYQSAPTPLKPVKEKRKNSTNKTKGDIRRHQSLIQKDNYPFDESLLNHITDYLPPLPSKATCQCQSINKCLAGKMGPPGHPGFKGFPGIPGKDGFNGVDAPYFRNAPFTGCIFCPAGPTGNQGESGKPGARGIRGPKGHPGRPGVSGLPGLPGEIGAAGDRGVMGKPGGKAEPGMDGRRVIKIKGLKGVRGERGPEGERGLQGQLGALGKAGVKGVHGPQGPNGIDGMSGAQGLPGADGKHGKDALYCKCPERKNPYWPIIRKFS